MRTEPSRYDLAAARFGGRMSRLAGGMLLVVTVAAGIWLGAFFFLPPLQGLGEPSERIAFALKCTCFAVVFCFLTGIEAISHERLQTDSFDPLAGRESQRLVINARYLQNTVEQLILFVPGLFGLALYATSAKAMFSVIAATVIWTLARGAFWIGYHFGPQYRVFGLAGMLQSMLVLLYLTSCFGYELGGRIGAAAPIFLFILIEAFLVAVTRPRAPPQ